MSMTMDDSIKRWTAKRKTALVIEIIQGKTTVAEGTHVYIDTTFLMWATKIGPASRIELLDWLRTDLNERAHVTTWAAHEYLRHHVAGMLITLLGVMRLSCKAAACPRMRLRSVCCAVPTKLRRRPQWNCRDRAAPPVPRSPVRYPYSARPSPKIPP